MTTLDFIISLKHQEKKSCLSLKPNFMNDVQFAYVNMQGLSTIVLLCCPLMYLHLCWHLIEMFNSKVWGTPAVWRPGTFAEYCRVCQDEVCCLKIHWLISYKITIFKAVLFALNSFISINFLLNARTFFWNGTVLQFIWSFVW